MVILCRYTVPSFVLVSSFNTEMLVFYEIQRTVEHYLLHDSCMSNFMEILNNFKS